MEIGDKVRILDNERKPRYEQILNKIGKIVRISTYTDPHTLIYNTNYYVEIPEFVNEYQPKGWWVFKNATSLRLISDEVTCDDQMDAYEYAKSLFNETCIKVPIMKESLTNKGDNYMTILEIYNERKREKINKKYDYMENAIKQCDPRYKVWRECTNTLLKLYEEDNNHDFLLSTIKLSDETIKKINTIYNTREEELKDLSDKLNEVQAQLSMCETYEQKQDILRTYKIIKENGRVNA